MLGGTFDPIHLAHLLMAEAAREQLGLDQVLFMPAPQPWRKAGRPITPVEHRLTMVRLAVAGNPYFDVSTLELMREGPTYTADTLATLHTQFGRGTTLHFILGGDALHDLPNWHKPQEIVELARLAVTARAGSTMPDLAAIEACVPGVAAAIERVDMPAMEISSTNIRQRVAEGRSLRYLTPPEVIAYIYEAGLYT